MNCSQLFKLFMFLPLLCLFTTMAEANDTLKVMTYNVLYYGDNPPCQAPHAISHKYLKTIIDYTQPDILGLVKMAAPTNSDNKFGTAPRGFPDSILQNALNVTVPHKYAYCPYTNTAIANNVQILFYNQHKLGFVAIVSSYTNITDFNTYKFYYKDVDLQDTHDTVFLYVTLNHDKSGDEFEKIRGTQIKEEMKHIKAHFSRLPNMINMGDFNTRGSNEICYQELVFPADTNFRFYDPPFFDGSLKYPANWDDNRPAYAKYHTTSTRKDSYPNACGSSGGAKNWYDHIFISSWLAHNTNRIHYIPNSYHTVGNDGKRIKISINDNNSINTSAPAEVLEALFQMSNKYPVMADFEVATHAKGKYPANTEINGTVAIKETVTIDNPVAKEMVLHFSNGLIGQELDMECTNAAGKVVLKQKVKITDPTQSISCTLTKGEYQVNFCTKHNVVTSTKMEKR
jgi:hypothetical protein